MKLVLLLISLSSLSAHASGTINVRTEGLHKKIGSSPMSFLCKADESLKDCQTRFKAHTKK